eukprot:1196305-Prorocentrum_minimum.AAC.4
MEARKLCKGGSRFVMEGVMEGVMEERVFCKGGSRFVTEGVMILGSNNFSALVIFDRPAHGSKMDCALLRLRASARIPLTTCLKTISVPVHSYRHRRTRKNRWSNVMKGIGSRGGETGLDMDM